MTQRMFLRSLASALAGVLLLPVFAAAQNAPLTSESTGEERTMSVERVQVKTPYQLFAEKLKLDSKTQVPAVEEILSGAAKEAAPVGMEMLQFRQQLVNLALSNKPDEMKPVVAAYAAAAAKMTGIEARAFAKVYATLKPNQQSVASQAFAIMAGMFQAQAPGSGARGGQRGGGAQ